MNKEEITMFDFNNGAIMPESEIKKWHNNAVEAVKNGQAYSTISSGRAMVIVKPIILSHDPDNQIIEVIEITNGYKRYYHNHVEIKDKLKPVVLEFAEWVNGGHGDMKKIYSYIGDGEWNIYFPTEEPEPIPTITTEQLYTLYQNSNQKEQQLKQG